MQDIDIDLEGILNDLLAQLIGMIQWGWGLLPFQSSHSLSLLVWFILATLGGVIIFIKFYGNGIIMESIEHGLSEVKRSTRGYYTQAGRFVKSTTKKKTYKKRKRRK